MNRCYVCGNFIELCTCSADQGKALERQSEANYQEALLEWARRRWNDRTIIDVQVDLSYGSDDPTYGEPPAVQVEAFGPQTPAWRGKGYYRPTLYEAEFEDAGVLIRELIAVGIDLATRKATR